jgi:hypothetical protein
MPEEEPVAEQPEAGTAAPAAGDGKSDRVPVRERVTALWRDRRPTVLACAAGLVAAAVAGSVLTVALTGEKPAPPPYTVAVTYKVTGKGTATIVYNNGDPDDPGRRKQAVDLPWSKKVQVSPKTGHARVSIILGEDGGRAACSLAVRGEHRQTSSAFGSYGRATCSAKVPPKNS